MGEPAGHESWTHGCWLPESGAVWWAPVTLALAPAARVGYPWAGSTRMCPGT
jgi:hypothetical protein